jgi:prolyl-tRNA synthetase
VELKVRATGERTEVAIDEVASLLSARVVSERA